MQSTGLAGTLARSQQGGPLEERSIGDGRVDPGQILEDRSPGAEVEMADLRVAHLPGRQADVLPRRTEDRVRPAHKQASPGRHVRRSDGVDLGILPDAEPVEDDQDDRPRASRRCRVHDPLGAPRAPA